MKKLFILAACCVAVLTALPAEATMQLPSYAPSQSINTTIFPNGSHLLTIKSTNNLGHVGTASVTVKFFN